MAPQDTAISTDATSLGVRTIQEQVFRMLHEWIMDGSLKPGLRLQMRDLARGFDTSVIPIREALRRLEGTGLVTQEPHRGYRVADLEVSTLHDYYQVRTMVEVEAVRRGAELIDEADRQELSQILQDIDAAVADDDIPAVLRHDEEFIGVICEAVKNDALLEVIHDLWNRVKPYKLLLTSTESETGAQYVLENNRQLFAACEAQDSDRAAEVVRASLEKAHSRLASLLELHVQKDATTNDAETADESLTDLCKRLMNSRTDT